MLVALDAFGVRGSGPLTYRAASFVLLLEAAQVSVVLAIVIGGSQTPATLITARLTPAPVLILMVWMLGLVLLRPAGRSLPWHESGQPSDGRQQPRTPDRDDREAGHCPGGQYCQDGGELRLRGRIARLGVDSPAAVTPYGLGMLGYSPSRTCADRDKTISLHATVE